MQTFIMKEKISSDMLERNKVLILTAQHLKLEFLLWRASFRNVHVPYLVS